MSTKKIISNSAKETKNIAAKLALKILQKKPAKTAVILSLQGDLGAGKTTFLQGFAEGLGIKEKVLSPTFIVMKKLQITNYKLQIPTNQGSSILIGTNSKSKIKKTSITQVSRPLSLCYKYFFHFDCYRLNNAEEVLDLGFKEIVSNPENIVAIEWPERIKKILPKKEISIKFNHQIGENEREICIENF